MNRTWLSFQVGCTYVGTVVGAGFASGQEVYQFFAKYGNLAYLGIAVAAMLFAWVGYRVMLLGSELNAPSFREVNAAVFGRRFAKWIDALILLMMFGVTVAMLAGAGQLFRERMGVSFQLGIGLTIAVSLVTLSRGIAGLLKANTAIVPIMAGFVFLVAVHSLWVHGASVAWEHGKSISLNYGHRSFWFPAISAVIYGALNIGLSAAVLIPLGAAVKDKVVIRRGATFGALGLGAMLIAVLIALFTHYPADMDYEVPMGYIATMLGPVLQWIYVFVLWGEIYSTLVGGVYGMAKPFVEGSKARYWLVIGVIFGLAYVFSQIGFSIIIQYGYAFFGWVSLFLLFGLLFYRDDRRPS